MPKASVWKKFASSGAYGWSLSLDGRRRKLTEGLEVRVDQLEARRAGEIEALIVVTDPEWLGELEAGLVCNEYYDERTSSGTNSGTSRRTITKAVEHEQWQPLPGGPGEHSVRFTIPPQAPFSYEGSCLSFRWEVVARGRRTRKLDARASQEISVRP